MHFHNITSTQQPSRGTIIFIHGAGMNGSVWDDITPLMTEGGYDCACLDLPGHGATSLRPETTIEAYGRVVAQKIQEKAYFASNNAKTVRALAGHSMGGLVALEAASQLNCSHLVLLGVGATMPVHTDLLRAAYQDLSVAAMMMGRWGFSRHYQTEAFRPHIDRVIDLLKHSTPGLLAQDLEACDLYRGAVRAVDQLDLSVGYILGQEDRMVPGKMAEPLIEATKNPSVITLPRCGHMMMHEDPASVAKAIQQILEK